MAQTAWDLGGHGAVLHRWVEESVADSQQSFPGQGQMNTEQAKRVRLRREVIRLKAEGDILNFGSLHL